MTALSIHELRELQLPKELLLTIVMHPAWILEALPLGAAKLTVLLTDDYGSDSLWRKYRDWLCARGDLVIAPTEPFYFEQCFRRSAVALMDGTDPVSDRLAVQALDWVLEGFDPSPLLRLQQHIRAERCRGIAASDPTEATSSYYYSIYRYLTGDLQEAQTAIVEAYVREIMQGNEHALKSHYLFLSAIQLKLGQTEQAIRTYEIAAQSEGEHAVVHQLFNWLDSGQEELARAVLFRLNDDYNEALPLLLQLADHSLDAKRILQDTYLQTGRLEQALLLTSGEPRPSPASKQEQALLEGTVLLLQGERHASIHKLLEAAVYRQDCLANLAEIITIEAAAIRLAEGETEHAR